MANWRAPTTAKFPNKNHLTKTQGGQMALLGWCSHCFSVIFVQQGEPKITKNGLSPIRAGTPCFWPSGRVPESPEGREPGFSFCFFQKTAKNDHFGVGPGRAKFG